jgi:hypothetical protein
MCTGFIIKLNTLLSYIFVFKIFENSSINQDETKNNNLLEYLHFFKTAISVSIQLCNSIIDYLFYFQP